MDNFIDVLELQDVIESLPDALRKKNFELLYSNLHSENPASEKVFLFPKM